MINNNLLLKITVLGRCKTKKLEKIKNVKSTKADISHAYQEFISNHNLNRYAFLPGF